MHFADNEVRVDLDPQAPDVVHFPVDDPLGQPELGDALDQNAAAFVERLEDGHIVAEDDEVIGDSGARGPLPGNGDLLAGLRRQVRDLELAQGAAALEADRQKLRADVAAALVTLAGTQHKVLEECRGAVLDLALEIASRVVRTRIESGDPVAARVAEEILAAGPKNAACKVRVHPEDHHALLAIAPALERRGPVEILPDPSVGQGGVVVETLTEIVDARIDTALNSVREALEEEL